MGWNYLPIPKLQLCNCWILGMDTFFHLTIYWTGVNLFMLGLKLNHVSKRGHWHQFYWWQTHWCLKSQLGAIWKISRSSWLKSSEKSFCTYIMAGSKIWPNLIVILYICTKHTYHKFNTMKWSTVCEMRLWTPILLVGWWQCSGKAISTS